MCQDAKCSLVKLKRNRLWVEFSICRNNVIIFFSWKLRMGEREDSLGHAKLTCMMSEEVASTILSPLLKIFYLIYLWSQAFEG